MARTRKIDNEVYDRLADSWWGETTGLSLLRTAMNPVRFPYFQSVLVKTLGVDIAGKRALDIGCGGGLLAEEFARVGFRVTGVDPSAPSIETAMAHASEAGLEIDYRVGAGERLPFEDASFDVVYCCDVLEHVQDVDAVIAEAARVLKPQGVYLYDTINRTIRSKIIVIKLFQEWEWTNFFPPDVHNWNMFIQPDELRQHLRRHGIEPVETTGISPGANPIKIVSQLRAAKQGKISYGELGRRLRIRRSNDTSAAYMGYGIRGDRTGNSA